MDLLAFLSQFGVSAVFAGIFYLLFRQTQQRDQVRADAALDLERKRVEESDKKYENLNDLFRTTVIPTIQRSADVSLKMAEYLNQQEDIRRRDEIERENERRIQEALDKRERDRETDRIRRG